MKDTEDIIQLIQQDDWMMSVLRTAQALHLPDWWVCAGFVRGKIWDVLHGYSERTPTSDIDVIYFDACNLDEAEEKKWEAQLTKMMPNLPWSVKNEARMHLIDNALPYSSCIDAMSKFPETATALGLSLDDKEQLIFTAPCGIDDVLDLRIKPTPFFAKSEVKMKEYEARLRKKNWIALWPKLQLEPLPESTNH